MSVAASSTDTKDPPPAKAKAKDSDNERMREQLIKLKRIATLYKDEVSKQKKIVSDSRVQTQQRNEMIGKLKKSLVAMKEQHKKQQQQLKQQLQKSVRGDVTTDALGARRPNEVLLRVRHASENWCLVQFESDENDDDDEDDEEDEDEEDNKEGKHGQVGAGMNGSGKKIKEDPDKYKWIRQHVLETQAYEQYGLRLDIPEIAFDAATFVSDHDGGRSSGRSVSGMQEELNLTQHNLERVQEEFRRYRVRSEIQKKQQETELNRVMQANLAFQQRRIAGDDGINAKLRASEAKADDLSVDLKNQAKTAHKLSKEVERYKKENTQLIQLLETGNRRRDTEGILGKFNELQKEYNAYKVRASDALKHKDAAIKRALENNGTHRNHGSGGTGGSGGFQRQDGGGGAPRVLPKNPTTEYLKNTIIQYMATDQVEVKEHMEAAIATVLQFTGDDIQFLKQRRDDAQGYFSSVAGFFR